MSAEECEEVVHVKPCAVAESAEQCVGDAEHLRPCALPPICAEFCSKVTDDVVVQFACDLKQEASMLAWMHFFLMDLCAALKSKENAIHRPKVSSWLKVRRTSKLDGRETFSGTTHAWLALQMELSNTRRSSFPSAVTMLSLPMADPRARCGRLLRDRLRMA